MPREGFNLPLGGQHSRNAFEQGAFASAIGPDHGSERSTGELPADVMQGRVPPVADRQIQQLNNRQIPGISTAHRGGACKLAHQTSIQSRLRNGTVDAIRTHKDRARKLRAEFLAGAARGGEDA